MGWKGSSFCGVCLIFFMWCAFSTHAQQPANTTPAVSETTMNWTPEQIEQARNGVEFIRKEDEKEKEEETKEEQHELNEPDPQSEWWKTGLFQFLAILSTAVVLVFIIVRLLFNRQYRDQRMSEGLTYSVKEVEEDLLNADPEKVLNDLLAAGNYTLATRMLFLALIKDLHVWGLVHWQRDKTNRQFLNEMITHYAYKGFRDLVDAYELVWFGDRTLDLAQFNQLKAMFDQYRNTLKP